MPMYVGWENGRAIIESEAGVPGVAYGYDMEDHRTYLIRDGEAWGNKSYALFYCVDAVPVTAPARVHEAAMDAAWESVPSHRPFVCRAT